MTKFKADGFLLKVSSLYKSAPQDYLEQDDFLNCVAKLHWQTNSVDLLEYLQSIEYAAGRRRSEQIAKGPRVLDLDILLFGDQIIDTERLKVPHKQMHQRRFVLEPLLELAADIKDPVSKRQYKNFLEACASQAIYSKRSILVH